MSSASNMRTEDWNLIRQISGTPLATLTRFRMAREIAINMPGVAFFGREPFSFVHRTEDRYQFVDNFSWTITTTT